MFYAHIILAKKGPLARIWLAAHWDKKITKAHVFETNIEKSVEGIMQPKVKLALRTSGHLLLGVVRIYSRKAKYLLADCNEAFVKIKMAFRPGMVDLPEGHREANVNAITLPEVFHDFDTALPEINDIDIEAQFSINQSRADEITMREDYGSLSLSLHDDGFGDIGFEGDTPDIIRGDLASTINNELFDDEVVGNLTKSEAIRLNDTEISKNRLDGDGFGDDFGQPELFEDDIFGEPPLDSSGNKCADTSVLESALDSEDDDLNRFNSRGASPILNSHESLLQKENGGSVAKKEIGNDVLNENEERNILDQSTLVQNEDESFALAPIDASAYKGVTKTKRKRKLIVDEIKNISGEEMKAQLANTSDIVTTLDLAPPTKRLMYWKETGGVEKLFSLPSRQIPAHVLFVNYQRQLISRFTQLEDFSSLGPCDLLAIDQYQTDNESNNIVNNKRGRKRKLETFISNHHVNESHIENTQQSLGLPEPVRNLNNSAMVSGLSLNTDLISTDILLPTNDIQLFESNASPNQLFSINEIQHLTNLNDIPLTPGNTHHGNDNGDDFNQSDKTPNDLNHGQLSPHHSGIENVDSIPILAMDQISLLNETDSTNQIQGHSGNKSCEIASDWNDYELPLSIEIQNPSDEQLENETNEQFEERVLNKRAAQLFFSVKSRLVKQDCIFLSELTLKNSRKQAAQKFYSLLVLKKFRALNISQSLPYSEVIIERGPLFENPKL